jgi:hypothetical protein
MLAARTRLTIGCGVLLAASLVATPARAATAPTYSLVNVGPKDGGEPSSLATADGTLYVGYPGGRGTPAYRSTDNGATWTATATADPASGDTCFGSDGAGGLYLCNLAGSADKAPLQADVWKSTDRGDHWALATGTADQAPLPNAGAKSNAGASSNPFGVDRQWVDGWVPPGKSGTDQALVVLNYHDFYGPSQIWVNLSSDGGKTFGAPIDVLASPANNTTARQNAVAAQAYSACSTVPTAVNIVKTGQYAGRVWVSWIAGDAATSAATGCNITQLATFHSMWAAYSDDGGATWTPELVFDGGVGHDASTPFAAFTLDNQGNPYYAFAMNIGSEYDMWLVWSNDGGATWAGQGNLGAITSAGKPIKVSGDNGTHIYPAIAAGDPGHVDVAYLATSTVVPTLPYGKFQPGGGANAKWYLWVAQGDLNTPAPTWTRTQVTPSSDPMHVGDICNLGIFCIDDTTGVKVLGTNRSLLDFISMDIDKRGFAHIAYTDDNPAHQASGLLGINVANQTSGPSLFAAPSAEVPEVPLPLLLLPTGAAVVGLLEWRRRGRRAVVEPATR